MSAYHWQGFHNDLRTSRPGNHEQKFNSCANGPWGYSWRQDGCFNANHLTSGQGTPMNYWQGFDGSFDIPMTDSAPHRRSSAISPRSIRSPSQTQGRLPTVAYTELQQEAIPHFFVPAPDSVAPNATSNINGRQHVFNLTSDASRSSSSTITSMTSSTNTSSTPVATAQYPFFSLLLDICTEGLRRKWQEELQKRRIASLAARRQINGRPRSHQRREPYSFNYGRRASPPHRNPRGLDTVPGRTIGHAGVGGDAAAGMQMMDYVRLVAHMMWEKATSTSASASKSTATLASSSHSPAFASTATTAAAVAGTRRAHAAAPPMAPSRYASHQPAVQAAASAERAALEAMQDLYALATSVLRAVGNAARGDMVYSVEEVRDVVGCAGRLCRVLGYGEGESRVEECGRECIWAEEGVL